MNERRHVLSTGYNGVAAGQKHCNEPIQVKHLLTEDTTEHPYACSGASALSGMNLEGCEAIHAEQNALLQCRDVWEIHTTYVTHSPCIHCVKLLLATSCRRVVFVERYRHDELSSELWTRSGREWVLGRS